MIIDAWKRLNALEPLLGEHESNFRRVSFQRDYRRLRFVLYALIGLTSIYMFKEATYQLIRYKAGC